MHVWVSACGGLAQNAGPPQEAGRLAARQAAGISSCAPGGVVCSIAGAARNVSPGPILGLPALLLCALEAMVSWGVWAGGQGWGWGPHAPGPKPEARPPRRTAGHSEPWEVAPERPV